MLYRRLVVLCLLARHCYPFDDNIFHTYRTTLNTTTIQKEEAHTHNDF